MRLTDLVDDLDVPPTRAAEGAWEGGVRRVRRRRAAAVGGVAAVVAVAMVVPSLGSSPRQPAPAPAPTSSTATPPRDVEGTREIGADVTQSPLRGAELERLLDTTAGFVAPKVPLAGHPLDHAVWAVSSGLRGVDVLGPDGVYRHLTLPHAARTLYSISPLRPTSLSPDGTRLAFPQPGRLVVADLPTATTTSYDVGGPENLDVAWDGDDRVVVQGENAVVSHVVSLPDGSVTENDVITSATFTPDGPVTWGGVESTTISFPDGSTVTPRFGNSAGNFASAPLVGDGFVVGLSQAPGPRGVTGPVVVDTTSGEPLAFLPTGVVIDPTLLLQLDGDRVVLGVQTGAGLLVVRWDWRAATVVALVLLPGATSGVASGAWGNHDGGYGVSSGEPR